MAERCLVDVKNVRLDDLRTVLMNLAKEMGCFDEDWKFDEFIEDISPKSYYKWEPRGIEYMWKVHPDYDYDKAIIYKCLSMIRLTQVRKRGEDGIWYWLFDLEEPNYKILPKKEEK